MKLLAKNQLVGNGLGNAVFRDLFEKPNGERISVPTSRIFIMQDERTLTNDRLSEYPSEETILNRHKL